jgi:sugar phosphate isomerase/epimerase
MGQSWGEFEHSWEGAMDIYQLIDFAVEYGLDGLHITAADCLSTQSEQLKKIRAAAEAQGLYLEYNFSMDEAYDKRLTNTLEEGITIAHTLGARIAKVSMDLRRPRPISASRFHPIVKDQLEHVVERLKAAAPMAQKRDVKLAVENHTDAFSEEVLWVLDQVNHPNVGACVDTVNAIHVTEDPIVAISNLAPRAFTNHFRDNRIIIQHDGVRFTGSAVGDGDLDMKTAYEIIRDRSSMNQINIELDMDAISDDPVEAQRHEREAVIESIRYCRDVLGI